MSKINDRINATHKCPLCGQYGGHNTPRKSKNCERRFRKRISSSPKAPEARQLKFKSAYLKRLYRQDILRDEE